MTSPSNLPCLLACIRRRTLHPSSPGTFRSGGVPTWKCYNSMYVRTVYCACVDRLTVHARYADKLRDDCNCTGAKIDHLHALHLEDPLVVEHHSARSTWHGIWSQRIGLTDVTVLHHQGLLPVSKTGTTPHLHELEPAARPYHDSAARR